MNFRKFVSTFILALGIIPALAHEKENYNGKDVVARQVLMKLSAQTPSILQQLKQLGDADDLRALNGALSLYALHSKSANVTALVNILKNHPSVAYVEPDYIVKTTVTPNDPGFSQQWAWLNTATPGADIGATNAWTISTGSTANVMGVVDTGIDYTHADLAANVWSAPAQFTITLSWGPITCPAGSHGYNAVTKSCDPRDDNNHGTHVAGTIGAVGNNSAGVTGVNWATRIMGLKFMDSTGSGSTSDAIDAMEFALQAKTIFGGAANVRVFSNSWGGAGFSQSLLNEINKANTADVLFVVAAGNSSQNNDTSPTYPASFTAPNIITVAATTSTDALASFSNYGAQSVHLGAPGVTILSTLPNGSYGYMSGTSMATPHVAGSAMLVLSKCPLNTAALRSAILSNVDLLASLAGITATGGRLNVSKAIRSCAGLPPPPASGTASFVKTDTTTGGFWKTAYGAEGYNIINDTVNYPAYVTVTPSGTAAWTWAASSSDPRALQKGSLPTDRIAACWYTQGTFSMDLNFTDGKTHQVAFYMLDWDNFNGGRNQKVDILDVNNTALDTRTAAGFVGGQYMVWNLSGHVILRVTNQNAASNAVLSGIFFGGGVTVAASGTAAFVKTDSTAAGTWKGVYGVDGYNVINDSTSYPTYVTVTPAGNSPFTWAASTTDARAPQKGGAATDRIAACWYSQGTFTLDLNFSDANIHQVALYMLDWDNFNGGRNQRLDVMDFNNNTVLDSRTVTGFVGGQYVVWNLSGHVMVRITNLNGSSTSALSGLFFGGAGAVPPLPPGTGTAAFVKADTTTAGTWKGAYGGEGFNVINDSVNYPSYVTVTPAGNQPWTWLTSTSDARAPQKGASVADRVAACWYAFSTFTLDLKFGDANTHQVALYMLDWDNRGRNQRVEILDGNNTVLDTRSATGFAGGQYLVWNLSGHVIVRITNLNGGTTSALSAILFGAGVTVPANGTAAFVKTDTTTAGTWKGVYGADGYNVIGDAASYPAYVTATPSGNLPWTWAASTTDPRAPQKSAATADRVAACWYNQGSFAIDLNFTDASSHQLALYLLDWDNFNGRNQRVDILDANYKVLDSRTVANFVGGQYLVWNVSGHVIVQITNLSAPSNAVLSGIFFR